ncbi:hypothetical protein [Marinomonas transparens]|nr:hypothetical protein [Marinomonas transparens]
MKGFDEAEVKMFCDFLLRLAINLEDLSKLNAQEHEEKALP